MAGKRGFRRNYYYYSVDTTERWADLDDPILDELVCDSSAVDDPMNLESAVKDDVSRSNRYFQCQMRKSVQLLHAKSEYLREANGTTIGGYTGDTS